MNVEIGTEAVQFPEKEYINGIFLAVNRPWNIIRRHHLEVSHQQHFKSYGFWTRAITYWFKNYLSGRSQKVDINGSTSDSLDLDISVIQGSISTLCLQYLFLCYIKGTVNLTWLNQVPSAAKTQKRMVLCSKCIDNGGRIKIELIDEFSPVSLSIAARTSQVYSVLRIIC